MRIVSPSTEIIASSLKLEKTIEYAGRICYKSEDKTTEDSHKAFIANLIRKKHESVLEHGSISVHFVCDRGVSHELVRHRIASYSQESTRYCNYSKEKFDKEITVIKPCFFDEQSLAYEYWKQACERAESSYFCLLECGCSPQEARSVLPNSLKTELVVTANPREWIHIFQQRTAKEAHPQMREIMIPLQASFAAVWPSIFGVEK